MRFSWFLCVFLFAAISCAQTAAPPATPTAPGTGQQAPSKIVAPDETVLTIKGVCAGTNKQADDCKTSITRAEFEKVANAFQPNMSPPIRRQLANAWARNLAMSTEAEKRGLEKQPAFEQIMRFSRMQTLSLLLNRAMQEEANNLSDADYQDYYHKNAANFEQADFLKIYVPRNKQTTSPKTGAKDTDVQAQQKVGEQAMEKFAAGLRARAVAGEDFEKLQKEAYVEAGFKGTPPETKVSNARRATLSPKQVVAFDLKPGEVSELISDPGGHYIYKMISKEAMPLEKVKDEIRIAVSAQRYRDAMQPFQKTDNAEFNEAYFGAGPKPPTLSPGAKPPAREDKDQD